MFSTPLTASLAGALLGLGWRNIQAHAASADMWLLLAVLPAGAGFAYTRGPHLQRSLFWIGLSLNGWLTLIALARLELDPSETGIFVNLFLSMFLLGTSLPHIVQVECTKQEVMSFGLVSGCAVEAALSGHITILKFVLSTALGVLGLAGLLRERLGKDGIAGLLRERLGKEEPSSPASVMTPFMPKTSHHLKQYSLLFMLGQRSAALLDASQSQKFIRLARREEKAPEKKNAMATRKHPQMASNAEVSTDIQRDAVLKKTSQVDVEKEKTAEHVNTDPTAAVDKLVDAVDAVDKLVDAVDKLVDATCDKLVDTEAVCASHVVDPNDVNAVTPSEETTGGIVTPKDFCQPAPEEATWQSAFNTDSPKFNSAARALNTAAPEFNPAAPEFKSAAPEFRSTTPAFGSTSSVFNSAAPAFNAASPVFNAAAPEFKSATPEFRSTIPAFDSVSPAFNTVAPAFNTTSSTFNAAAPEFKSAAAECRSATPTFDPASSVFNSTAPAFNAAAPEFKSAAPEFRSTAPAFDSVSPVFNTAAPAFNTASPTFNAAAPEFKSAAPEFRSATPVFDSVSPAFNTTAPVFNAAAPEFKSAAPEFRPTTPVFNTAAPEFTSTPRAFNSAASAFNSTAPAFNPIAEGPVTQLTAMSPALDASYFAEETHSCAVNHHASMLLDSPCLALRHDAQMGEPVLDSVTAGQSPAVKAYGQKIVFNAQAVEFVPKGTDNTLIDDWNAGQLLASPSDLRADACEFHPYIPSPDADYTMLNASNYSSPEAQNTDYVTSTNNGVSALVCDDDYDVGVHVTEADDTRDIKSTGAYDYLTAGYATKKPDPDACNDYDGALHQQFNVEVNHDMSVWTDEQDYDANYANHKRYAQEAYHCDTRSSCGLSPTAGDHPRDWDYLGALQQYYQYSSSPEPYEQFDPHKRQWAYRDPKGRTHRAFSSIEMLQWYKAGFFDDGLKVAYVPREDSEIIWKPMGIFFPKLSEWPLVGQPYQS